MTEIPLASLVLWLVAGFLAYLFIGGFVWGAGYFPTSKKEIEKAVLMLDLKEGATTYDLGSGFGKVVIFIAEKYNARCVGVEIDPIKCWWSRWRIRSKRLSDRVTILRKNLLDVDLSEASSVYIFLSQDTSIMKKLRNKMFSEMKPGSKVVSYIHRFGSEWLPERVEGKLYLYSIPELKARLQD